jgi:hypothetical protein
LNADIACYSAELALVPDEPTSRVLYGQLGDGTTTNRTSAVSVTGLSGIAATAGGAFFSLAATGGGS